MTRPHALLLPLAALALLAPTPALAAGGAHLDADLNLGAPLDSGSIALGFGGRFGWRVDFGPLWLQPEVGGDYTTFLDAAPTDTSNSGGTSHAARVFGGAHLGGAGLISGVIEPALFGHAGYGWISSTLDGPAFDVGFALDVNVVRYFRFGLQGAYNVVTVSSLELLGTGSAPAVRWLSYGVHAGVSF